MSNKTKYIILAVLLILILVFYYWYNSSQTPEQLNEQPVAVEPIPGQTILPNDQLPLGINSDMILEESPTIVDSYRYDDEGGQIQSTVRFLTQKPLEQIKEEYTDYLTKNKWEIASDGVGENGLVSISASKDQSKFYITAGLYNTTSMVVDLTLVQ